MTASDRLRIGDEERESAAAALGRALQHRAADPRRLDERSRLALEARTAADLRPLFADLPLPHGPLQHGTARLDGAPGPHRGGRRRAVGAVHGSPGGRSSWPWSC